MCHFCRRRPVLTWMLGDERGVCARCIRAALFEAERAESERVQRTVLERLRRMGFG